MTKRKVTVELDDDQEIVIKKAKKKKSGRKCVSIVLDATGSMAGIREQTISGVNEYLSTLRRSSEKLHVTLITFNTRERRTIFDGVPVDQLRDITHDDYVPDALTNLYDAVGLSIRALDRQLESEPRGTGALVMIVTDGYENASVEWTQANIKRAIEERTKDGWTFTYLGADLSQEQARHAAGMMGVSLSNAARYGKHHTAETYANLAGRTVIMARSAGARGMGAVASADWLGDAQGAGGLDDVITGRVVGGVITGPGTGDVTDDSSKSKVRARRNTIQTHKNGS
jgi:uncharacterized protein YegL